mgnify:CR=1 FL=1
MDQHRPHCNAVIFKAKRLDEHTFGGDSDDPQVVQSGAEHYADCPACGQPVRMEPAPHETGTAWVVSHNRK